MSRSDNAGFEQFPLRGFPHPTSLRSATFPQGKAFGLPNKLKFDFRPLSGTPDGLSPIAGRSVPNWKRALPARQTGIGLGFSAVSAVGNCLRQPAVFLFSGEENH